jgi:hypothetical protein
LLVQGRVIVEDDRLPGVDMAELGARARDAVALLKRRVLGD